MFAVLLLLGVLEMAVLLFKGDHFFSRLGLRFLNEKKHSYHSFCMASVCM
jgi:hypothetical protein